MAKFMTHLTTFFKDHPYRNFILLGALLAMIPLFHGFGLVGSGTLGIWAYIIIITVVALGLNILLGFSGLISLGTAGFVGAGALGTGVFLNLGFPFLLAAILSVFIAAMVGALIGFLSLKVEGLYLAIATLFVGEILRQIFTQVELFGGQMLRIGAIDFLGFIRLSANPPAERRILFGIIIVFLIAMMILMYHLTQSKTGRALLAMSRSESAAQAMGIVILKYRLVAFVTATVFASVGGVMYALYFQNVPTTAWTLDLSLFIIAMVVVGGFKSIYGTLLGAFIIHGIPNLLLKEILGDVSYVFSGVLIISVILFYPYGAIQVFYDVKKWFLKLKAKKQGVARG
jgi:branched-chain amino acid transport system permease protein